MATKSSVRFTINAGGKARTLFSAHEQDSGTVFIRPKKEAYFRRPGQIPGLMQDLVRISTQKYSIHASKDSPERVNTIHSTTTLEGQKSIEFRNLTKAIKSEVGFAFMNLRRCTNLAHPDFVSTKSVDKTISLGAYDPSLFTLYYAIVVGAQSAPFNHDGQTNIGVFAKNQMNVNEHAFEKSRLTVLWSFLAAPSHSTSLTFHNTTVKPETPEQHAAMMGKSNIECVDMFSHQCAILEREQIELMMIEAGKPANEGYRLPIQRWYQDGMTDTGATADFVDGVTGRTITI